MEILRYGFEEYVKDHIRNDEVNAAFCEQQGREAKSDVDKDFWYIEAANFHALVRQHRRFLKLYREEASDNGC